LLFGKGQRVHLFNESGGFVTTQCRRQLAIVIDEYMLAFGNFVNKTQIALLFNTQNSASLGFDNRRIHQADVISTKGRNLFIT
jgi:hypothetical protein